MSKLKRRLFISGTAALGIGAIGLGGSFGVCSLRNDRVALLTPLHASITDIKSYESIGNAWLRRESAEVIIRELLASKLPSKLILIPQEHSRREYIETVIRDDFSNGRIALVDDWVTSITEARIAASWILT